MVIDSSVILAIYFNEPFAAWALDQIEANEGPLMMSTVNLTECLILIRNRNKSAYHLLEEKLLSEAIKFIPPSVAQAQIAAAARLRYPLNLGDCFAYALCKEHEDVLLAIDADFRNTDIKKILPRKSKKP
jgi:ribonuclease VapC